MYTKSDDPGNAINDGSSYEVILRAQRGSPEDIGLLYLRYHQPIYRYLFYRTGDPQTAEDLTAEVFLKMIQALRSYRFESTPFLAWLFQIARNLAIDHYRRSQSHPVVAIDDDLDSQNPDLGNTIEQRLSSAKLAQAMGQLNETQRDVLLMRFIQEMPIAEAAQALHKSEDAIKALQRRGLQMLRVILSGMDNDHGSS